MTLDFLVRLALWKFLVSMEPGGPSKKTGKPRWVLNAAAVLRELAGVDRIAVDLRRSQTS